MTQDLVVRSLNRKATSGVATIGPLVLRCGLGISGLTADKREGDGATPAGRWPVTNVLYRPNRLQGFHLSCVKRKACPIRVQDGWCDAIGDRNYNRPVQHPYPGSAERLWRNDHLYDVIVILRHNRLPRVQGRGSAIFMHLARELDDGSIGPTAGCVSLRRRDLALVLGLLRPGSAVHVVR
jgi:L,D-peptidoglycan transpeptidase YkuD (ErfK/YbiS/YcfS/YnhG family)